MKYLRVSVLLVTVLLMFAAPSLQAAMCTAEYATCEESGDQEPGGGGTGSSSPCEKCVRPGDGYSYCKPPEVFRPAGGMVVAPCATVYRCEWDGSAWQCSWTCSGSTCYWV